jgi:manganese/iron transport system ATP-binding protein
MSADALEVRGLSVDLDGRRVLEDVTFTAPPGALVGVLGPNGAGKTTLLRALLGLLPYRGRVALPGPVAYVPQSGSVNLAFPVDALGVVAMARYPRRRWGWRLSSADRALAGAALEEVGMAELARRPFDELSGGQRQRVLVARALAQEGDVLLLDEPLSGIDIPSQDAILAVVAARCAAGALALITTHDLAQAARVCQRLVLLDRVLIAEGSSEDVMRADVLRRAYGSSLLTVDGGSVLLDDDSHHHHDHA